mmetsp:Transcript_1085/g.2984  ORF Transcript_1085/g.2984 Transcript_1085/m.2984 type:complete len:876 (-) Transcript_1085:93-2720(-)|eukprot:CAMPEP_0168730786 /NCGR_PEP_ID=MMETSP0724-20121128/6911_1 /TAXON_ID=265536 /ORGANISM="Amphiprora sp., Strain CCMP467" /LENGTH=875 /DNA_ID=CAMNT_0008777737 /DNA_START=199 /DNA_END=2826 /DNA_ORIENTATION=-
MEARRSTRVRAPAQAFAPELPKVKDAATGKKRGRMSSSKGGARKKTKTAGASNKNKSTRKNPKRKSAPQFLEDCEGNQVWLTPANLQDIARAQQTKRSPFGNKKRLYLHTVTSPTQRQMVYDLARRALEDIEQCLLPTYGGRPWQCQVTVTDPTNAKGHAVSPYFIFGPKGRLELAAWSHVLMRIPSPPKFPGYYASSQARDAAKTKKKKEQKKSKGQERLEDSSDHAGEDDDVATEESDDEEEEEEIIDEEMEIIYDLQERDVTPLSELAHDERWRVPLPNITTKWISPLREIFTSRKSAWEHAVALCKQDVLLEKMIRGHDLTRNRPLPLTTVVPAKKALHVGQLRFKRDGLWVIGQEDMWKLPRSEEDEAADRTIPSATQRRSLSALQLYIQSNRKELQQKRQAALHSGASEAPPEQEEKKSDEIEQPQSGAAASESVQEETKSDAVPRSSPAKPKKFTLKEADDELRKMWKALSTLEKESWKKKAASDESASSTATSAAATVTPLTTSKNEKYVSEVSDGESTHVPLNPQAVQQSGRVTPSSDVSEPATLTSSVGSPAHNVASQSDPTRTEAQFATPPTSSAVVVAPKAALPSKSAPWKKWCLDAAKVKQCYDAGMEHYDTVIATVKARDLHRELQDGFDVLRERGRGRFDMELPAFDEPEFSFLTDLKKAPWMPVVRSILGKDVVLIHKGIFLAFPGAETQAYHQDGVHLTSQTQRDAHAINVFVPLVDLTMKHGPTEFCLGTHILNKEEYDANFVETPVVSAGTPIIFDYRLGHNGLANKSGSCRPVLYCTYACENNGKEFRDSVNFSRKRYHRIGDLINSRTILSRQDRAEKRKRAMEQIASEEEEAALREAIQQSSQPVESAASPSA